jgi:hypothetical protein
MRDTPRQLGLHRLGSDHYEVESASENPIFAALRALSQATRSPAFWLLSGSFFVCGASTNGLIGTHLIPACVDHGFSEIHGANLLAAIGLDWYLVGSLPLTSLAQRQLQVSPVCSERWKELTIMPFWFLATFASSRQYRFYSSASAPVA